MTETETEREHMNLVACGRQLVQKWDRYMALTVAIAEREMQGVRVPASEMRAGQHALLLLSCVFEELRERVEPDAPRTARALAIFAGAPARPTPPVAGAN